MFSFFFNTPHQSVKMLSECEYNFKEVAGDTFSIRPFSNRIHKRLTSTSFSIIAVENVAFRKTTRDRDEERSMMSRRQREEEILYGCDCLGCETGNRCVYDVLEDESRLIERASRMHAEQRQDVQLVEVLDDIMHRQEDEVEIVRGATLNGRPIDRGDW